MFCEKALEELVLNFLTGSGVENSSFIIGDIHLVRNYQLYILSLQGFHGRIINST